MPLCSLKQLLKTIRFQPGVVIQKEKVFASCGSGGSVVPFAEAEISAMLDEDPVSPTGQHAGCDFIRPILRAIVRHNNLELGKDGLAGDGFQTSPYPPCSVVVQDYHGERGRG